MSKEMVISANPHETRVAILEEGQLCEYYVEREKEFALVGSIYKGKVTRVLPGMQSAFVEIGLDSDAFLYVSDFMEEIEELDHVVTTVEDKAQKMEDQGGQVFPANTGTAPIIEPLDVESTGAGAATSAVAGLEPLPGESISAVRGSSAPGTFSPAVSRPSSGGHDRGRFENRSRGGRPGGDRGGRFGRRGGSGGGRGRSGGGSRPGGDRGGRFGRELPSSKYASSRPPEDQASEPGAPEGHISTLLPGESLAKFRERSPSDISASAAQTHSQEVEVAPSDTPGFAEHESPAHESEAHGNVNDEVREEAHEVTDESVASPRFADQRVEHRPAARESSGRGSFPARESFPRRNEGFRAPSSSGGLEPLPGETLSKWKAHTHLPPEPVAPEPQAHDTHGSQQQDNAPVPDAVRFAPLSPLMPAGPEVDSVPTPNAHVEEPGAQNSRDWNQVEALSPNFELSDAPEVHEQHEASHHEAAHHEEHPHVDLTEEEAAALAEHIADAQDDDAARDAQQRVFAAADASAEAAESGLHEDHADHGDHHAEEHESEEHAEDSEDAELEQEEAAAEEEGMIAPPESEHEHDRTRANPSRRRVRMAARFRRKVRQRRRNSLSRRAYAAISARACRIPRVAAAAIVVAGAMTEAAVRSTVTAADTPRRPQQPRRTQLIADMLKQGQEIIVQIAKEPLGKKGARITSHVALPGRFLVYMPTLDHTGVSRKIASAEERARLRHLVTDAKGSSGGGFIVRTAAASAAPDEVRADVEFLTRTWSEIKARSETAQGAFPAASRFESGGTHSARLHHAGFWRHLGGHRRGIHQGRGLHEPLPAAASWPREAVHQGNAGFRRIRHPAGN